MKTRAQRMEEKIAAKIDGLTENATVKKVALDIANIPGKDLEAAGLKVENVNDCVKLAEQTLRGSGLETRNG